MTLNQAKDFLVGPGPVSLIKPFPNLDSPPNFLPGMLFPAPLVTDQGKDPQVQVKASNPKEAIGSTKLNFALVPASLMAYAASAFTEGALKYGAYNWRVAGVRASTYIAAQNRHVNKWVNGESFDPKTKVHHLANAIACLGIILDAELTGQLNDDRPPAADMGGLIERLEATVAHLQEMSKGMNPHHYTEVEDGIKAKS